MSISLYIYPYKAYRRKSHILSKTKTCDCLSRCVLFYHLTIMCEIFHFYTHIWFPCLYPICKSRLRITVLIGKIYLHVYGSDQRAENEHRRCRRASFQRHVHMALTYFRTTVVWVSTGTVVEATGVETTTSSDEVKIGCRSLSWSSVEAMSFLFSIYVNRGKKVSCLQTKKEEDEKRRGNAIYMSALRSVIG